MVQIAALAPSPKEAPGRSFVLALQVPGIKVKSSKAMRVPPPESIVKNARDVSFPAWRTKLIYC